jgi:glycosyltransferase involved in cell wall biosynthesis
MSRITYLSPPASVVTGGVKMLFRHVDALCAHGFDARVATPDGDPPTWFATTAPVVAFDRIVRGSDILVFPETRAAYLEEFAGWGNRKLVFAQSVQLAFRGLGRKRDYAEFGVEAMICPSHEAVRFCRRRFPRLDALWVPYPVDPAVFSPRGPKRMQIAFAPRKRPIEAMFIADLFRATCPEFSDLPWVVLARMSEGEVAQRLAESMVYLSLNRFDSFGLSALEALASGCVVAGFTGIGGREYATSKNGFWAPEDDCIACADQLAEAVRLSAEGGPLYEAMTQHAAAAAADYTPARFHGQLTRTWRALLDGSDRGPAVSGDVAHHLTA